MLDVDEELVVGCGRKEGDMATVRGWLTEAGFDWDRGLIVYQSVGGEGSPGWTTPTHGSYIDWDHPVLDMEFFDGFGGPEAPRFLARDDHAVYFPGQYDGSTWCEKVVIDLDAYIGDTPTETPYPGG